MLVLWHQHQRRFHNFGAARAEARSLSSEMKKKHWGRQKVNRSESIWGQHLPFSSLCSFLPWIFLPFHSRSCFKLLHNTTEFNQQLEMTAGADGRARSIVLACEEGAPGGNETQKERWGGEGDCDRQGGWRIRTAKRQRGGLLLSNEGWGEKVGGITSIKGRRLGSFILTPL